MLKKYPGIIGSIEKDILALTKGQNAVVIPPTNKPVMAPCFVTPFVYKSIKSERSKGSPKT